MQRLAMLNHPVDHHNALGHSCSSHLNVTAFRCEAHLQLRLFPADPSWSLNKRFTPRASLVERFRKANWRPTTYPRYCPAMSPGCDTDDGQRRSKTVEDGRRRSKTVSKSLPKSRSKWPKSTASRIFPAWDPNPSATWLGTNGMVSRN